jgi:hypothetical protein
MLQYHSSATCDLVAWGDREVTGARQVSFSVLESLCSSRLAPEGPLA